MKDFIEEAYSEGFTTRFSIKERLYSAQSPFQKVEVVDSTHHGRMLFNDGCAMVSERDEFIYHEMMAHVPLFLHPHPERVLVIGGGDGGTAREVLRHASVQECVMVEIDAEVIESCRKFIPQTSSVFTNSRLNLITGDGVEFMAKDRTKFDVILIDSTDPVGPAQPLFGADFYRNVLARLNDVGIVVAQGETPFYQPEAQKSLCRIMSQFFTVVRPYNFTNMTYPGGLWSFIFASRGIHPLRDFQAARIADSGLNFSYYNEDIHQAAFSLPQFQRQFLSGLLKP